VLIVLTGGLPIPISVHQWPTRVSLAGIFPSSRNLCAEVPGFDVSIYVVAGCIGDNLYSDLPKLVAGLPILPGCSPSGHNGVASSIVVVVVGWQANRSYVLIGAEFDLFRQLEKGVVVVDCRPVIFRMVVDSSNTHSDGFNVVCDIMFPK